MSKNTPITSLFPSTLAHQWNGRDFYIYGEGLSTSKGYNG